MGADEVIWNIINNQFCSFKVKTETSNLCRNEYNVTGLCNRQSCPLANHQYATVREHNGRLYLFKKVVERAHLPSKMWEKIILSTNVEESKKQIEEHLQYWSPFIINKCKLRVDRITEVMKKMRRIENSGSEPILLPRSTKKIRRDRNRENRALEVARLQTVIEKELLERLQKGVYGEIYNFNAAAFEKLAKGGKADELQEESEEEYQRILDALDDETFMEALSEEEDEDELEQEFEDEDLDAAAEEDSSFEAAADDDVNDEDDEQMMKDLEDLIQTNRPKLGASRAGKRSRHVEIEYESEGALPKRILK